MLKTNKSIRIQYIALIAGLLLVIEGYADFKRDYGTGMKEYSGGDYPEAIEKLQKAIDQESKSQEQVRIYGMRYEPYIPYFYLGLAKFKNGDCAGAVKAWRESISQGVIKGQEQFSELQASMAQCEASKVDISAIAKSAEEAIGTLESNITRFAQLNSDKNLASEWASRWKPELDSARSSAQSLKTRLASAVSQSDEAAIKVIQSEAKSAADSISGTRSIAVARSDSLKENAAQNELKQRNDARQSLSRAVASGKSVKFSRGNEQMASLQKQLESLLAQGSSAVDNSVTSSQEYLELAQNISNVSRRYASAEQDWQAQERLAQAAENNAAAAKAARERRIPPASLKQIAQAYFAGNYKSVVDISNPDKLDEERAKVQALLFRAAANYKLYVLSGEKNADARQRSESDIREIKRLDRNFKPYIAAFSPKFLELFRQTS